MPRRSRAKTLNERAAVRERPAPEAPPEPAYEPCPRCKEPVPVQASYHHECLLYPPETMRRVYGENWRDLFPEYEDRGKRRRTAEEGAAEEGGE